MDPGRAANAIVQTLYAGAESALASAAVRTHIALNQAAKGVQNAASARCAVRGRTA